jgi:PAS domain S-box-containing protein
MRPALDERLGLLVEATSEYAIYMLDRDGLVSTWNTGARRIKGYEAEEIIGRHVAAFYVPEDVAAGKPEQALETARTTGQHQEEGWRVRRDGSRFWANVLITAIFDADGELEGYAKITRDESDRVEATKQAKLLGLLVERDRIADDLRDTVVHRVFEAGLILQGALKRIDDAAAVQRVHDAIDVLDDTLRQIRNVVADLQSPN